MDKSTQGKKSRSKGKAFELKVRADLEKDGWIVDRWTNNISEVQEQDIGEYIRKLIPCKPKFNPFTKSLMMMSGGFPDFIAFRRCKLLSSCIEKSYHIFGVECKSGRGLEKEEKEKCKWLIENNIFSKIAIATKGKKRGQIEYTDFKNEN
jgi:hypothetical protein